ncbi:hypothetical protein SAMN05216378_4839 [Paenibacillus catalpae]|uniref:Uncharacterized protein n=1 Tax=Paenibacillus catalpae TaxID=1045775 RepID=A0A1I2FHG9_9BACL|nr:hypothetical protein [Paenibacillus catalpae]SFF04050.1 hypothetical protein SAMN05216378_4839 [Paenibacillus catalpae]
MIAILFVTAGCANDSSNTAGENSESSGELGSRAEVTEGDFVYRLVSEKPAYGKDEKIVLYAELEYVGKKAEVKIAHAASPFYFPMKELTRGYEIVYSMDQPRIITTLKKGEVLKELYRGSGGYSSEDAKPFVDFIKAVSEAQQKGTLPEGEYEVYGAADFEQVDEHSDERQGERIHVKSEIRFVMGK